MVDKKTFSMPWPGLKTFLDLVPLLMGAATHPKLVPTCLLIHFPHARAAESEWGALIEEAEEYEVEAPEVNEGASTQAGSATEDELEGGGSQRTPSASKR